MYMLDIIMQVTVLSINLQWFRTRIAFVQWGKSEFGTWFVHWNYTIVKSIVSTALTCTISSLVIYNYLDLIPRNSQINSSNLFEFNNILKHENRISTLSAKNLDWFNFPCMMSIQTFSNLKRSKAIRTEGQLPKHDSFLFWTYVSIQQLVHRMRCCNVYNILNRETTTVTLRNLLVIKKSALCLLELPIIHITTRAYFLSHYSNIKWPFTWCKVVCRLWHNLLLEPRLTRKFLFF